MWLGEKEGKDHQNLGEHQPDSLGEEMPTLRLALLLSFFKRLSSWVFTGILRRASIAAHSHVFAE